MKKLVFILFFIGLSMSNIRGQVIDKYSIACKVSIPFQGVEVNAFSKRYIYTIAYYNDNPDALDFFGDKPQEVYNQISLLFGKYHDDIDDHLRLQYQAGLSWFWVKLRTDQEIDNGRWLSKDYETKQVRTIGLPLKVGFRYIPFKFLSIGLDLRTNLNFEKNILSGGFAIEIGKLR